MRARTDEPPAAMPSPDPSTRSSPSCAAGCTSRPRPLTLVAGIVLVALSPTRTTRIGSAVFTGTALHAVHRVGDLPHRHLVAARRGRSCAASTTPTSSCSSPAPTRRSRCCCSRAPSAIVAARDGVDRRRARRRASGSSGPTPRAGSTSRSTSRSAGRRSSSSPSFLDGATAPGRGHRHRHLRPDRGRRRALHLRRRGLRLQAAQPLAAVVRLPRGLPHLHDRWRSSRTTSASRWRPTPCAEPRPGPRPGALTRPAAPTPRRTAARAATAATPVPAPANIAARPSQPTQPCSMAVAVITSGREHAGDRVAHLADALVGAGAERVGELEGQAPAAGLGEDLRGGADGLGEQEQDHRRDHPDRPGRGAAAGRPARAAGRRVVPPGRRARISWVPREARTCSEATSTVLSSSTTETITVGASVWWAIHSGTPTFCSPNCIATTELSATRRGRCGRAAGAPARRGEVGTRSAGRAQRLGEPGHPGRAGRPAARPRAARAGRRHHRGAVRRGGADQQRDAPAEVPSAMKTLVTTRSRARTSIRSGPVNQRASRVCLAVPCMLRAPRRRRRRARSETASSAST